MEYESTSEIRTRSCPRCHICGGRGEHLYNGLKDRLFSSPGEWNLKKCVTSECGLVWLDPMPVEEDIGKAYRSYVFTEDQKERPSAILSNLEPKGLRSLLPSRRLRAFIKRGYIATAYGYIKGVPRLQRIAGCALYLYPFLARDLAKSIYFMHYRPDAKLLDVGCGDGSFLDCMRNLGWEGEGVEIDSRFATQASNRGLTIYSGTLEQQRFDSGSVDAIVLCHVLEHVHHPLALLRECHRILRPDGTLTILVPNIDGAGHRRFKSAWLGLDPPRHLHLFTACALRQLVLEAGFSAKVWASASMARLVYLVSASIAAPNGEEDGLSTLSKLKAFLFDLYESIGLFFQKDLGEEIVVEGVKSTNYGDSSSLQQRSIAESQPVGTLRTVIGESVEATDRTK
jgi:2-polyprenyl-3-methyl-5-hydroxy-6-metoxy-1,4-benzoquinol methylase